MAPTDDEMAQVLAHLNKEDSPDTKLSFAEFSQARHLPRPPAAAAAPRALHAAACCMLPPLPHASTSTSQAADFLSPVEGEEGE